MTRSLGAINSKILHTSKNIFNNLLVLMILLHCRPIPRPIPVLANSHPIPHNNQSYFPLPHYEHDRKMHSCPPYYPHPSHYFLRPKTNNNHPESIRHPNKQILHTNGSLRPHSEELVGYPERYVVDDQELVLEEATVGGW